jgi:UDP-N-acetylglucosamine--N-acetylmuramyl-(pentapeptide) pyrophosphoryl-undecaprenol N-acetylglucosamine transferase
MKGKTLVEKCLTLIKLPFYLGQALVYFLQFKPSLVIGGGGYVSFMAVVAGFLLRKKTFILEQNSVPGLTNRILGHIADRVFLTFSASASYFKSQKVAIVGNPLRRQMEEVLTGEELPRDKNQKFTLLVLGGSQGALTLNEAFLEAIRSMGNRKFDLRIIHQTGKSSCESTKSKTIEMGLDASVYAFIEDLENVYPLCDLVVSRAGAGGISEIMAFGKASILVPYPFAADNHQWENARVLVEAKAAVVLKDDSELAGNLLKQVIRLWDHPIERKQLAKNAQALHQPKPAQRIVDHCLAALAV